jgi:hypothetical protein
MSPTLMASMIVLITALCQAIKMTKIDSRWIPLIAVSLGIAGSMSMGGAGWMELAAGVVTGLSSSGLYSVYKRTIINK